MYTCIHTCVGVHASFLCGYRALSCGPCRGTAPPMRWGPAWASGRGSDTPFVNLVLSRAGKKKPKIWRKARWCGFARGWYFVLCVCVSFFFFFPSLSPPTRPPLGLWQMLCMWKLAILFLSEASPSPFLPHVTTPCCGFTERERGRERDHSVKSIKPWSLVCSS